MTSPPDREAVPQDTFDIILIVKDQPADANNVLSRYENSSIYSIHSSIHPFILQPFIQSSSNPLSIIYLLFIHSSIHTIHSPFIFIHYPIHYLHSTTTISIIVTDVNDHPPVFINTTYAVSIPEVSL